MNEPALLSRVLDAHGGLQAWRSRTELELRYRAGGLAFASKMRGLRIRPWHATVELGRPRAVLHDYPAPGRRGIMEDGRVRIEAADGQRLAGRDEPRSTICTLRHRVAWDDLDLLYFCAYAIWGYATFPFHLTLPGVHVEQGEERSLRVLYPESWPVHSREQYFHFDERGLLVRNDYTAEVMMSWAHAVHVCEEPRDFQGLVLPTRRHVHPKWTRRVTLVRIEIDEVTPR